MMATKFSPDWLAARQVDLPPVTRGEIIGLTHVMAEIESVVERLADTAAARALGAQPPKGILFYGPPGSGKTLVARYLAGTLGSDVPMYELSSDELTAPLLRGVFRHLASRAGRSVAYLDEIDGWGLMRDAPMHSESSRVLLVSALAALDGLVPTAGPVVIASSNRPPAALDPALVRSGRLGIHIRFDLPDEEDRAECFQRFLIGRPVDDDIDIAQLARLSRGTSPAAIRGLIDDAAGLALARHARFIGSDDLVSAVRRSGEVAPEEDLEDPDRRWRAALHEAGHLAVACRLRGSDHVYSVRLTAFGGVTETGPDRSDRDHVPDDVARDSLVISFGGLAAERAVLGEPSLSSRDDVERGTQLALARIVAGVEPAHPPVSLDALHPYTAETLKGTASDIVTRVLEEARARAASIVEAAGPAIERFAQTLDGAGELVGPELHAAIDLAGIPGPDGR